MVVDELVVTLGLDPKKFNEGQREAINSLRRLEQEGISGGKRAEVEAKRAAGLMQNLRREALSTFGIFVGGAGVGAFIQQVTKLDAATGRMANAIGVSAHEIDAWESAVQRAGGAAGSAKQAISGLNAVVQDSRLTGDVSALSVFSTLGVSIRDEAGKIKDAAVLLQEAFKSANQRADPREAAALLARVPGMNTDTANAGMKKQQFQDYLTEGRKVSVLNKELTERADAFVASTSHLQTSVTNAGKALVYDYLPGLTKLVDKITELVNLSPRLSAGLGVLASYVGLAGAWGGIKGLFGGGAVRGAVGGAGRAAAGLVGGTTGAVAGGILIATTQPAGEYGAYDPVTNPGGIRPGKPGGVPPRKVQEEYIRRAAAARGIDPDVAVAVAAKEGLNSWKSTIPGEESYGPFQLHYGGRGQTGALAKPGLADEFKKKTGLEADNPANWQHGINFALDEVLKKGWGQWYGWKGDKWAGIGARSVAAAGAGSAPGRGGGTGATVTINKMEVNAPKATDAEGVAREIGPQLQREMMAAAANGGN